MRVRGLPEKKRKGENPVLPALPESYPVAIDYSGQGGIRSSEEGHHAFIPSSRYASDDPLRILEFPRRPSLGPPDSRLRIVQHKGRKKSSVK